MKYKSGLYGVCIYHFILIYRMLHLDIYQSLRGKNSIVDGFFVLIQDFKVNI